MLLSADLQETYHTQCVGMLMMYICTIHNSSNNGSSVILHLAAATMLFTFYIK
jgi:hypothetical protein